MRSRRHSKKSLVFSSRRVKREGVLEKKFLPVRSEIVVQSRFAFRSVIATKLDITEEI